jgi:hypothetical protein
MAHGNRHFVCLHFVDGNLTWNRIDFNGIDIWEWLIVLYGEVIAFARSRYIVCLTTISGLVDYTLKNENGKYCLWVL